MIVLMWLFQFQSYLPARASKQGNVIGLYTYIYILYIYMYKKNVIEQTRDLIYLKFVATYFFRKLSAGKNSGDSV